MITTREIDVYRKKANLKHRQVTTKTVDASIRVEPPKEPIKKRGISTTTLPDVADIAEKKRRDDIMAEKAAEGFDIGDTVYQNEDGNPIVIKKPGKTIAEIATEAGVKVIMKMVDEEGLKKLNMRHVFVEIDGLIQAVSRRELK